MQSYFKSIVTTLTAVTVAIALTTGTASARPKYAKAENVGCDFCHFKPGGERNFRGLYYGANDHSFAKFDELAEARLANAAPNTKGEAAKANNPVYPNVVLPKALNFMMKDIDGKNVSLGRYYGDVSLVVNVASFCGNTPQYTALQKSFDKYKGKGFNVLGFPANEFGKQEPGSEKDIKEFCTSKYNVTFPMFSKIVVKGEGINPFYKFLTDKESDPKFAGDIDWNFAKFLINRKGEVIARFPAKTKPDAPEVVAAIEKALEAAKQ
ncbi:MAG: glutathione peroxidase [Chthonomonadales bacterium]